jgi:glycosyltransferase involved in cell wall biosynthesis
MNILQISYHTAPFGSVGQFDSGGLNVYVQQISKHLSQNHNVTVVTGEKAESFKNQNLEFCSLNLFEPNIPTDDKEIHLVEFNKRLEEVLDLKQFDIIHAHYWMSGLIAKDISNKFNIPYIFTSHSLGVFLEGYNKERADCEKIVMSSSQFITASTSYEETLISDSYQIDSQKIKQIKPGVDSELFSPDQSTERENIFLSIGRIQQQKGQLETLKFLNSFKEIETDFKCYFVGGPSGSSGEEYLLELKKIVKDLSLDSYVEFLGNLPQVDITNLLNRSKLLIHTSQYETFGLVAIEANSTGVPVLTSNTGSMNEIIVNNKNGYLAKDLFDSNVNTFVKELLLNDKKFDEISKYCLEKSKEYDWSNTTKELEKLYKILA